jgi:hypothetical protein
VLPLLSTVTGEDTPVDTTKKELLKQGLFGLFASLWLLDTASTIAFVAVGGVEMEANPVMRAVMIHAGMGGFAFVKAGILVPWGVLTKYIPVWVHLVMIAVLVPVVYMGCRVAWY